MSSRLVKSRWRELFSRGGLEPAVRSSVAKRVVNWMLAPLWLAALAGTLSVLVTVGVAEPTRFLPAMIVLGALGYLTHLQRKQAWLKAAALLIVVLFVAIAAGVLLHSVHAPIYSGGFVLLALVIPLFGMRWGIATALALLGVGGTWMVMDAFGVSTGIMYPAAGTRLVLYFAYMVLSLVILGGIQQLLAEALSDARRQHRDAEQAREAEQASELAFHAVFDQAGVGMVLLTAAGKIMQLNHRAATWLGASQEQLLGQALDAAPHWTDARRTLISEAVTAAAQGTASQHEMTMTEAMGAQLVYQVSVSPFHARDGRLSHVIVEVVDVSDLVQTRTMLAQARRLEALGKLSGGVAHDINNMLAVILAASDLVRSAKRSGNSQKLDPSIEMIQSAVQRASSLTKQLLAFGRQDRLDSRDIDLNRLVLDMGGLFERTLHKAVSVVIRPCDEPVFMRGDMAALEHALLNLALNAQDAMPNGGTLCVSVLQAELDAHACAKLNGQIASGPAAVISVSDTGTGMSATVRERLFEPFFTTKSVGKGTGLGLAAVHGTVRNHHGAIAVESQLGAGSRFELYFPATQTAATLVKHEPRWVPGGVNARVLLADDEVLVRETLGPILEAAGCRVHAVENGEALIDALAEGQIPDVIVSDLMMPGLCGIKLVHMLEATAPGCPLLLMTGFSGEDVGDTLSGRSPYRLLRKPFGRTELMTALQELLPAASGRRASSIRSA